jgi:hypothetical protein
MGRRSFARSPLHSASRRRWPTLDILRPKAIGRGILDGQAMKGNRHSKAARANGLQTRVILIVLIVFLSFAVFLFLVLRARRALTIPIPLSSTSYPKIEMMRSSPSTVVIFQSRFHNPY